MPRPLSLVLLPFLLAVLPSPGWAAPITLVVHGGWKGAFVAPDCRDGVTGPSELGRAAASVDDIRRHHQNVGLPAPVVLHVGDAIFPGPVGRFLLSDGPGGADSLLGLLDAVGYDAVALGGLELSPGAASVRGLMERSLARDFPWTGDNLSCPQAPSALGSPAPAICAAVRQGLPARVIERAGLRLALLSALTPSNAPKIAAANRDGLRFGELEEMLAVRLREIEEGERADLVILQVHLEDHSDELAVQALLSRVSGVDLAVMTPVPGGTWALGKEGGTAGWVVLPGTGTILLPAARSVKEQLVASFLVDATGRVRMEAARMESLRDLPPLAAADKKAQAAAARLCTEWGRPIGADVPLSGPLDRAGFATLTLETMRHLTRSEVAILNNKGIRGGDGAVATGHLTLADVHTLLPFGAPLVRARISGGELEGLAGRVGGDLVAAGLESGSNGARVNGRVIDWARTYTIVVDQFLADGGDGILSPTSLLRPRVWISPGADRPEEVGTILVRSIAARRFLDRKGRVDPRGGFPDLGLRPLWRVGFTLDVAYMKGNVVNPLVDGWPGYSQSELSLGSSEVINLDGRLRLRAEGRMHAVDLDVQANYGAGRYEGFGDGFTESSDILRGALTWEFAGLRALGKDNGWVPLPIVQAQLDSEFDRPVDREWHHLMLTGVAGAKVRPVRFLEGRVGANLRKEQLKPGDRLTAGGILGITLDSVTLFSVAGRPFDIEARGEWLFNDLAQTAIHELEGSFRLSFSLVDRLRVSANVTGYAYRDKLVAKWGTSLQVMLGLGVTLDAAAQTF